MAGGRLERGWVAAGEADHGAEWLDQSRRFRVWTCRGLVRGGGWGVAFNAARWFDRDRWYPAKVVPFVELLGR